MVYTLFWTYGVYPFACSPQEVLYISMFQRTGHLQPGFSAGLGSAGFALLEKERKSETVKKRSPSGSLKHAKLYTIASLALTSGSGDRPRRDVTEVVSPSFPLTFSKTVE